MKKLLLCATLASTVLQAQAQAPAAPATPPAAAAPASAMPAIQALLKQYQDIFKSSSGNPLPRLDALAARPYAPELASLATTIFGDPQALHLRRLPDVQGKRSYALGAPAHTFSAAGEDFKASWSEIDAQLLADRNGRRITSKFQLDQLDIKGKDAQFALRDLRGAGEHRRAPDGAWLGKVEAHIASIQAGPKDQFLMRMDELSMLADVTMRNKNADIKYDFLVKSIKAGPVQVDRLHMGTRLTRLDVRALEKFQEEAEKLDAGLDPALQLKAMSGQLRKLGKVLAARGSAVEIDDISASYKGHKATVKGRVSFDGARPADFDDAAALAKKVLVRLEVRVPVALVKEVTLNIARGQTPKNADGSDNEALIAQSAQSITDVVIGKMLGQGYARLDNGVLVSTIQFRHGKLTVNGKEVQLPTAPAPKPGQPAAVNGKAGDTSMTETNTANPAAAPDQAPAAVTNK